MRNLNKDEKVYITTELCNKIIDLRMEETIQENIKLLIHNEALANKKVSKTLEFLETIFSKDEVFEGLDIQQGYDKSINVKIKLKDDYTTYITVKPSKKLLEDISKQENFRNSICVLKSNFRCLNLEKYYILFGTWTAPNTERLNKINELIELIWSDFEADNSELMKAIK